MRRTRGDVVFDAVNTTLVSVFFLLILYPLYFIIIASISNPDFVNIGAITFWPRGITLEGYQRTLREVSVWRGYRNTILYTVLGTSLNVSLTLTAGYALSTEPIRIVVESLKPSEEGDIREIEHDLPDVHHAVVALDERGKDWTTQQLAQQISRWRDAVSMRDSATRRELSAKLAAMR